MITFSVNLPTLFFIPVGRYDEVDFSGYYRNCFNCTRNEFLHAK